GSRHGPRVEVQQIALEPHRPVGNQGPTAFHTAAVPSSPPPRARMPRTLFRRHEPWPGGRRGHHRHGALAGGQLPMAGFATIQLRYAEAAAAVESAELILLTDMRHMTQKLYV